MLLSFAISKAAPGVQTRVVDPTERRFGASEHAAGVGLLHRVAARCAHKVAGVVGVGTAVEEPAGTEPQLGADDQRVGEMTG